MGKKKQPSFKELQKFWYSELKRSGFNDLEHMKNGLMQPKALHPTKDIAFNYSVQLHQDTYEYYRSAGIFLHEYKFQNELDKRIWELHSEGLYTIDIVLDPMIRASLKQRVSRVNSILTRLKKEFKNWIHEVNKNGASR